ncbi:CDP-alcohol phosphatidyltransferase family protein [Erythrobacter rubeus]|uniref:CDP-alcohol phosphatidyltransferase family protein n=1 Tax=Erythrobacter rubeus TaxID=2760803 RepID=A0ABR8KWC5_9SPHN|nr:CDP-alcohol phosphatidyltransferase family protein [Erythrobacter rubeus]MBD2842517.1 CDP-alcohol phosphatidyltransferase family protein [Erythrobacter rubeus]
MRSFADLLTIYRIVAAPVVAAMAIAGQRDAFFILLIISLATDAADGPISRWTGTASRRGARLDTIADALTTIAALLGLYIFERTTIEPDIVWLYAFLASYAAAALVCLAKFRVLPAYHLYLSKLGAVLAGLFIVALYVLGYSRGFLIAVFAVGIAANLESIITTLRLQRFRADIGSVFRLGGDGRGAGA